ncbi:MAG: hypothetical protein CMB80_04675 [Flammeovirgaceae bacterium]|nr:hypothetical protein [Flammeovirgaceae bacterium]
MQSTNTCEMEEFFPGVGNDLDFRKFHAPSEYGHAIVEKSADTLLMLLRNPVENIVSYHRAKNKSEMTHAEEVTMVNNFVSSGEFMLQMSILNVNIRRYASWARNKAILRYEDLMINEEKFCKDMSAALSTDFSTDFLEQIPILKTKMMNLKTRPTDPFRINTAGNDNFYFRKMLNEMNQEKITTFLLESIYGEIFDEQYDKVTIP